MNTKKIRAFISGTILFFFTLLFLLPACSGRYKNHANSIIVSSDSLLSSPSASKDSAQIKGELTKVYVQAITDYIRLVNKEYNLSFDTLYFGKRKFGQDDDFPDIELPAIIEKTNIKLISPEQGNQLQNERHSSFYINLIGHVNSNENEFIFVAFSEGFAHQFDCFINYNYNTQKQLFEISNFEFKNYRYKKSL